MFERIAPEQHDTLEGVPEPDYKEMQKIVSDTTIPPPTPHPLQYVPHPDQRPWRSVGGGVYDRDAVPGQFRGRDSNAQSTAYAVQGLVAVDAGGAVLSRALGYLRGLQRGDGSVSYSSTSRQTPVWVTAQALTALARKPQARPSRERKLDGRAEARLVAEDGDLDPRGERSLDEAGPFQDLDLAVVHDDGDELRRGHARGRAGRRGRGRGRAAGAAAPRARTARRYGAARKRRVRR